MSTWANTPRSLPRALFFGTTLALLLVFVFSVPAFAADLIVNDDPGCSDATGSPSYCHIQAAIDAAAPGATIKVYPGNYSETAASRTLFSGSGLYQFGLFISKDNLLIQGVNDAGLPITDPTATAAYVTTNATNNFGPSGIWVEGNGVTIAGIKIGPNTGGENKTIEVIGDNFILRNSDVAVPGGGSVYLNDERFNTLTGQSYLKSYTIEGNLLEFGTSIDVTNGAGLSGPVNSRQIKNNKFLVDPGVNWAVISFSGSDTGVPWYVQSVGGAVITGNKFVGGEQLIRARGTYDNAQFNWQSYWNDNTFDRAAVTLVGTSLPGFDVRTYSYPNGYGTFNNVRRIGALIQPEIANAAAGDTVLIDSGQYAENLTIDKRVKLVGVGSSIDPAANTVLRPVTGNVVTITGSGASEADPLLLKALRIEPQGTVGINLGNGDRTLPQTMSYVRLENVQVAGVQNQAFIENERCLNLDYNKSVAHLTVLDSSFSQCDHGWAFFKNNGPDITSNTAQFVSVTNSTFANNSYKGLYLETLSDAVFENVIVFNNGLVDNWNRPWNGGIDLNLKGDNSGQIRAYQNLVFRNMTMVGNGVGAQHGAALMLKVRDDVGYAAYPATLTNVLVENGLFTGNERGIRVGEPGKNTAGPDNVQIHNAAIYDNSTTYSGVGGSAPGGLINYSRTAVNAENNWWGSNTGPKESVGNPSGAGEVVSNANSGSIDYVPWLGQSPSAALSIPNAPVDLPTGATSFTLPVNLNPAAGSLSSTAFSLDYDTACLRIYPADSNGDGIPEAISDLPGGFVNSIMLDTADADGELDVAMWDVTPPLASLPAGAILKVKFDILPACQGLADKSTFVKFSSAPTPTFSDSLGNAVYRGTQSAIPLLLDYNQPPTAISLSPSPSSVAENAPVGTTVGTLSVSDPDGDAPVYTLSSACSGSFANGDFTLSGNTLKTAVVFNFETTPSRSICVEANDGQDGIFAAPLVISITDINEPPTGIALSGSTVWEGDAAGTVVGTFSTSGNPEVSQTFSYSLVSGDGSADNGKFTIAGDQLKLAAAMPDYAAPQVLYIRVRSTDSGTPPQSVDKQFVEQQFVIRVLDHSLLSIDDSFVVRHNETIGIPVVFTANGNAPTSAVFGISYNPTCLTYVSTSGGTASASSGVVNVTASGSPIANGTLVTLNFTANPSCLSGTSVPLAFTPASLTGLTGPIGRLPVSTDNGQVLVISNSARGDCNNDGFVNAGDFSAIVLETFDSDLPWWLDAPQSTFKGSPVGCDANASKYIDVADVVCTVLVVFGDSSCTGSLMAASEQAAIAEPATLAVAPVANDSSIEVPVTLDRKGTTVAAAAFTLTYDPTQAAFDSSDADGDGIPDAVVFTTAAALKRSVSVDATAGRIKIAVYGLSLPLPAIDDGLLATVHLQPLGDQPLAGLSLVDAALGSDAGRNTPVEVAVSGVQVKPLIYLPAVLH